MISVIMPVYNGEKFVREAIDSILAQTFGDFEFLIIDDGSKDNTEKIISEYDDKRIRYFRIKHVGIPKALNYAIWLAKYDLIAIMNADDICKHDRFEKQLEIFQKDDEIGVVGTNYIEKYNSGKVSAIVLPESHSDILQSLPLTCCFGHPTIILKKQFVLEVGGYDENLMIAHDWDLYLRLYCKTKFHNIQIPLVTLRKHGANISNISNRLVLERRILLDKFYSDSTKSNDSNINIAEIANFSKGYHLYYTDSIKESALYFRKTLKYKKLYARYIRYYFMSKYFSKLVIISRKYKLYKKVSFLRRLDKRNVFFLSDQ